MTRLLDAIKSGDVQMLGLLMAISDSMPPKEKEHALFAAVRTGRLDLVNVMLNAKVNPQVTDSQGNTLVKVAAENGAYKLIPLLLERGCSVNKRNTTGASALHYAAKYGYEECARELIEAGADVNYQDSGKSTPLILAAKQCHITGKVVRLLVLSGKCKLDIQDDVGRTALHYCCHRSCGGDVLLEAGADTNIQDREGNTPLIMAASEGLDHVIASLMSFGANPDIINCYKKASIHILAAKNHPVAIEVIACLGGSIDLVDGQGNIPLWYAVNHNRPEAVKILLQANCHTEPPSKSPGGIPLATAMEKRLFGIAKLLILAGCKLGPLYSWLEDRATREKEREIRHRERLILFPEHRESSDPEDDDEEEEVLEWFDDWIHRPHTLKQICRIFIRRHIGNMMQVDHEDLPIPPAMQQYILLKEVHDHDIEGTLM